MQAVSRSPYKNPQQGFTLIEMLIAVALVGILAAVAIPSYSEYVRRGHRAEARAGLLQAAQWMERASTATGAYPTIDAFNATTLTTVPSSRYTIAIDAGRTDSTYSLTATPQNAQTGDRCGAFTLRQDGLRGAKGKKANEAGYESNCWSQ
ncbi:MAG: type IV pilin protein [Comamonas sp.]